MSRKFDGLYMGIALKYGEQSHDKRAKVGCYVVKDDRPVSSGWNGTPPGDDNTCQDENNVTKPNVIHAEINAIIKAARDNGDMKDSTVYCTLSPCIQCANALRGTGIKRFVFKHRYVGNSPCGIAELEKSGIEVEHYED